MRGKVWMLGLGLAWACDSSDDRPADKGDDDDTTTGSETGGPTTETDPTFVEPLTFLLDPALRANPSVGLTTWVDVSVSRAATLELDIAVDGLEWTISSPAATEHQVLVLGLRPDADYTIDVRAVTDDGASAGPFPLAGRTDPLPTYEWLDRRVVVSDPSRMEPGVTLFADYAYAVMVDADGTPCWYMEVRDARQSLRLFPGNLVAFPAARNRFDLIDLSGVLQRRFTSPTFAGPALPQAVPVPVEAFHHDVIPLPNGNVIALSIERREVDYRTSETDPLAPTAPAWVAGDVIVELDPAGAVVGEWKLHDLLDTDRIAYDAVDGDFWEVWEPYRGPGFVHDWTHANALSYDEATDTILVSLRHQDAIVGLSRSTGQVSWIIAPPANWSPPLSGLVLTPTTPGYEYAYHQHGAHFTADGTILMFDNGNRRASAFETPARNVSSRALELRPNLAAGTYSVVWEWASGEFAGSLGGVDLLPQTRNRLVTYGNLSDQEPVVGRVYEVTEAGEVVWQADLHDAGSWFRTHRLTGVIPGPGR